MDADEVEVEGACLYRHLLVVGVPDRSVLDRAEAVTSAGRARAPSRRRKVLRVGDAGLQADRGLALGALDDVVGLEELHALSTADGAGQSEELPGVAGADGAGERAEDAFGVLGVWEAVQPGVDEALDLEVVSSAAGAVLEQLLLSLPEAVVQDTQHRIWLPDELTDDVCVLIRKLGTVDLDTKVLLCIWVFKYGLELLQQHCRAQQHQL